jgi:hypothetical protein
MFVIWWPQRWERPLVHFRSQRLNLVSGTFVVFKRGKRDTVMWATGGSSIWFACNVYLSIMRAILSVCVTLPCTLVKCFQFTSSGTRSVHKKVYKKYCKRVLRSRKCCTDGWISNKANRAPPQIRLGSTKTNHSHTRKQKNTLVLPLVVMYRLFQFSLSCVACPLPVPPHLPHMVCSQVPPPSSRVHPPHPNHPLNNTTSLTSLHPRRILLSAIKHPWISRGGSWCHIDNP